MDTTIAKTDLWRWAANLAGSDVYAPRRAADVWSYEVVGSPTDVALDYSLTATPVKSVVFRQREPLVAFREVGGPGFEIDELSPDDRPAVVFGVRPCEGRAMALLDMVFGGEPEDTYYTRRRRHTTLVGLACAEPPSEDCFCTSVNGSPHSEEGLDVLLTDLGDRYYVRALSEAGAAVVAAGADVMAAVAEADAADARSAHAASVARMPRALSDLDDIHIRLANAFEAPLWAEEARSCISCGICTYLCPTCHCFDINDEIDHPAPLTGVRVRTWDSCQFPDFTMHSSGHNPRPDTASRLRQRISHKFRYFVESWGELQCTGCGRCIALCPVGIDLIRVVEKARDHVG